MDVSPTAAAVAAGLSNAAPTGWAKGAVPRKQNREKLCAYFGVPLDYLDDETKKAAAPEGSGSADDVILRFLHSLSVERIRGLLVALDAPKEVLDALDREEPRG